MLTLSHIGDKEKRSIDQQNRELKLKLLSNIDEVDENLRNVKSVLAGKLDDVHNKILQIEASTSPDIALYILQIHQRTGTQGGLLLLDSVMLCIYV